MTLFPFPLHEMAEIVGDWGGRVFFDGAHQLGLIAGGQFQDPLRERVAVMTGSAGKTFSGEGNGVLKELFNYLPDDLHLVGAIAAPMPIGDRLGGFVLLGSRAAMFTEDDRRLATTLTLRAGAQLASAHAVALSRKESARYSLMNELVKEASGKTMQQALELVLDRGTEVVRYDAGRAVLFQPDDTYVVRS